MKSSQVLSLFMISTIALSSCSNKGFTEPEQIGPYVFEILKKISTNGRQDYFNAILPVEEVWKLGKSDSVIKAAGPSNKYTNYTKEQWINDNTSNYNGIKEAGARSGIVWHDIEYLDFVYKLKTYNGLKGFEGGLFFKYNEDIYTVEVTAIWIDGTYRIAEIEALVKEK